MLSVVKLAKKSLSVIVILSSMIHFFLSNCIMFMLGMSIRMQTAQMYSFIYGPTVLLID